jgi:hypothetical protein
VVGGKFEDRHNMDISCRKTSGNEEVQQFGQAVRVRRPVCRFARAELLAVEIGNGGEEIPPFRCSEP